MKLLVSLLFLAGCVIPPRLQTVQIPDQAPLACYCVVESPSCGAPTAKVVSPESSVMTELKREVGKAQEKLEDVKRAVDKSGAKAAPKAPDGENSDR